MNPIIKNAYFKFQLTKIMRYVIKREVEIERNVRAIHKNSMSRPSDSMSVTEINSFYFAKHQSLQRQKYVVKNDTEATEASTRTLSYIT